MNNKLIQHLRQVQQEGREAKDRTAIEGFNWDHTMADIEKQFAKGDRYAIIGVTHETQKPHVIKVLTRMGFVVENHSYSLLKVRLPKPWWKSPRTFAAALTLAAIACWWMFAQIDPTDDKLAALKAAAFIVGFVSPMAVAFVLIE